MSPYIIPGLKNKSPIDRIRYIIDTVLQIKGFETLEEVTVKSRKHEFVYVRQLCFYFLRKNTRMTFNDIAKKFGYRDHSNIITGLKRINSLIDTDSFVEVDVWRISNRL